MLLAVVCRELMSVHPVAVTNEQGGQHVAVVCRELMSVYPVAVTNEQGGQHVKQHWFRGWEGVCCQNRYILLQRSVTIWLI